jgi:hypothetical protein
MDTLSPISIPNFIPMPPRATAGERGEATGGDTARACACLSSFTGVSGCADARDCSCTLTGECSSGFTGSSVISSGATEVRAVVSGV